MQGKLSTTLHAHLPELAVEYSNTHPVFLRIIGHVFHADRKRSRPLEPEEAVNLLHKMVRDFPITSDETLYEDRVWQSFFATLATELDLLKAFLNMLGLKRHSPLPTQN